jgi:hypothetical protein
MNGRITVGKDGKRTEHFLKPGADHSPEEIARAKKYVRGVGKAFKALTPDEVEQRRVKPAAPAPTAKIANKKDA